MKKLFVLTIAFMTTSLLSKAQCDGTTKWTCSKMKIIDVSGNVVNEKDENILIEVSSKNIVVIPGDEAHKMQGVVDEFTCKWTEPGKDGKTIIKSKLTDMEKTRNAIITIEGVKGKITITLEAPEEETKIVLEVKEYASVK